MQTQFRLTKITEVEYTNEEKRVLDIEVDHPNHLYLASSKNGALGVSHNSAEISLTNLSDDRMRHAKSGQWWVEDPQRSLANISVAYTEKPGILQFMKEWISLYESKSGERGIFNRQAVQKKFKKQGRRKWEGVEFLTNPCSEISLRSSGLCNLTEVIIREDDDLEELTRKVVIATVLGTFQSTLTNFRYLRSIWKKNAEEERLLGVSLTGIMDHPVMSGKEGFDKLSEWLLALRAVAIDTNKVWAEKLGINQSVAVTCTKPSGTVSQLVDSSSGIHPRYSQFYIRTVRNDKKDPLSDFLISQGVPYEQDQINQAAWVFSFPKRSPSCAIISDDMRAIAQLEHYKVFNRDWAEHSVSITVYVREDEWLDVAAWVYNNFDDINGVSFLPHSEHSYEQAPYQPIDEETYNKLVSEFPTIDWYQFRPVEYEDNGKGAQLLACAGGFCEL